MCNIMLKSEIIACDYQETTKMVSVLNLIRRVR